MTIVLTLVSKLPENRDAKIRLNIIKLEYLAELVQRFLKNKTYATTPVSPKNRIKSNNSNSTRLFANLGPPKI